MQKKNETKMKLQEYWERYGRKTNLRAIISILEFIEQNNPFRKSHRGEDAAASVEHIWGINIEKRNNGHIKIIIFSGIIHILLFPFAHDSKHLA